MSDRPADLRDAHLHLAEHGASLRAVDLSSCASADEALQRIALAAQALAPGAWVRAIGARPEGWRERAWPSAGRIEEAAGGRPCIVRSFDHHALAASVSALRAAGVEPSTPEPEGGVIVREGGRPTGVLLEKACDLVWAAAPAPTMDERREHVRTALADLRALGYVEVHDMLSEPWLGPVLADLADRGEEDALAVRVLLYAPIDTAEQTLESAEHWTRETVRLAGAKLFLDGTLNSRTAWMLRPYAEPVGGLAHGKAMYDREGLDAALSRCDILGLPPAMHAIGDGAVRAALDAVERVGVSTVGARIEHCEVIDEADVPRFAELGVIASVQPCHLLADVEAIERIIPESAHRVLPLRELIDESVRAGFEPGDLVWFGSDAPVVPPRPEDNLRAAVERRRAGAPESAMITPAQRISREEWLSCQRSPGVDLFL